MTIENADCGRIRRDLVASKSVGWIASAETKATAGLTLQTVLIGLVMMDGTHDAMHPTVTYLFWGFLASGVLGGACCLLVLWPRTRRSKLLGVKGASAASPTFFGDVAAKSFEAFRNTGLSNGDLERDATEQAYILAKIASVKMWWVKASFLLLGTSVILLAALALAKFHADDATTVGRNLLSTNRALRHSVQTFPGKMSPKSV